MLFHCQKPIHPMSLEKDFRPISPTPIAAKVLVMKWFDGIASDQIDDKQYGGLVELPLLTRWSS